MFLLKLGFDAGGLSSSKLAVFPLKQENQLPISIIIKLKYICLERSMGVKRNHAIWVDDLLTPEQKLLPNDQSIFGVVFPFIIVSPK